MFFSLLLLLVKCFDFRNISEDFKVDRNNSIIKQLQFGAGIKKREKERNELEKIAKREMEEREKQLKREREEREKSKK